MASDRGYRGDTIAWESEDGHRGLCRLDDGGRLVAVEVTAFPGDWSASSFLPYLESCASDDGRRQECAIQSPSSVRLERQESRADCIEGETWGADGHTLWVDAGCRGLFEVRPAENWSAYTVLCESQDGRRQDCEVRPGAAVRLVQRESRADCVEGTSWGFYGTTLWVNDGCRALFEVSPP